MKKVIGELIYDTEQSEVIHTTKWEPVCWEGEMLYRDRAVYYKTKNDNYFYVHELQEVRERGWFKARIEIGDIYAKDIHPMSKESALEDIYKDDGQKPEHLKAA